MLVFFKNISIWALLLIAITLVFIATFPTRSISVDEDNYYNNAVNIVEGNLKQDCDPEKWGQFQVEDYCIYKYNIGTSIILLPAVFITEIFDINSDISFITPLIAFLLTVFFFSKILKNNNLDQKYLILFALYPSYLYFTRTYYSEIYSVLIFTLIFYLLDKVNLNFKRMILIGVIFGLGVLVRYTNLIVYVLFLKQYYLLFVLLRFETRSWFGRDISRCKCLFETRVATLESG